jgi:hypothetical protein
MGSGTIPLYDGSLTFPFNGVGGYGVSNQINNAGLKPIFTTELEFGVEARFFKDVLGIDAAFYDKKNNGQIFPISIAPSTGYTTYVQNIGQVTNRGIELAVTVKPVTTKDINWSLTWTYSKDMSHVDYLTTGTPNPILFTAYSAELRAVVGKTVAGIYAPVPQKTPTGQEVVNPATGLPIVNTDPLDQYGLQNGYYGSALPDYIMGLYNSFRYKDFSLFFTLDLHYGGVMWSETASLMQFTGQGAATTYNDRKPFIIPGSVNASEVAGKTVYTPNTTYIGANGAGQSDAYYTYWYEATNPANAYQNTIFDRSFLKLRDITIAYNLPSKWASKIGSSNASISIYGRNFLLWVPKSNIYVDPEATNFGNDLTGNLGELGTAPVSKSYGFALKLSF